MTTKSLSARHTCAFLAALSVLAITALEAQGEPDSTRQLKSVIGLIDSNYVDSVRIPPGARGSLDSILSYLDPQSAYLPARQISANDPSRDYIGIGLQLQGNGDTLEIQSPVFRGPADRAGMLPGDKITGINGQKVDGKRIMQAVDALQGPSKTQVNVEVVRQGVAAPIQFEVTRGDVPYSCIGASCLLPGDEPGVSTGYLRLTRFTQDAHEELVDALNDLRGQGMTQLILDLRSNAGGVLSQAIRVTREFVPGWRKILSIEGRNQDSAVEYRSNDNGRFRYLPVIVLVNRGSAAGSEVMAAALQDLDRALIVGEPTRGQAMVQQFYDLPNGDYLKLTTAKWHTPSGRCIDLPLARGRLIRSLVVAGDVNNFDHSFEKNIPQDGGTFVTRLKRTVTAGDGVIPDYFANEEVPHDLVMRIKAKELFRIFTATALAPLVDELRHRYGNDKEAYVRKFVVSEGTADSLLLFAAAHDVEAEPSTRAPAWPAIGHELKAEIAEKIWGEDGRNAVELAGDPYLQKIARLFVFTKGFSGQW